MDILARWKRNELKHSDKDYLRTIALNDEEYLKDIRLAIIEGLDFM